LVHLRLKNFYNILKIDSIITLFYTFNNIYYKIENKINLINLMYINIDQDPILCEFRNQVLKNRKRGVALRFATTQHILTNYLEVPIKYKIHLLDND